MCRFYTGAAGGYAPGASRNREFGDPADSGILAQKFNLGLAIAATSPVYVLAGLLLVAFMWLFVERDSARMQAQLGAAG